MNFFLATDIGEEISEKVSENSAEKVSELSSYLMDCHLK